MQCPRWNLIPGPLALLATALPTELKEISTNTVSRGGYESTTVPITLGRGEAYHYSNKTSLGLSFNECGQLTIYNCCLHMR